MCMCLFSIEIQTAGRIRIKFGTEVVLEGGKFPGGGVDLVPPPDLEGPGSSVTKFQGEFIKSKL